MEAPISVVKCWQLCQCAGAVIYNPYPDDRVARLLFGTAAQEGRLKWRRQLGLEDNWTIGGFGLWQVERGSIRDSLDFLENRHRIHDACISFLSLRKKPDLIRVLESFDDARIAAVMTSEYGDPIGIIFARLHYLRVAAPIPESLAAQADYWSVYKRRNMSVCEYMNTWTKLCACCIEGD